MTLTASDATFPTAFVAIARVLGIPDEDYVWVHGWFHTILHAAPGSPEASRAGASIAAYVGDLVAARRRAPGDDLVSVLAAAGDRQLVATLSELVLAGLSAPRGWLSC